MPKSAYIRAHRQTSDPEIDAYSCLRAPRFAIRRSAVRARLAPILVTRSSEALFEIAGRLGVASRRMAAREGFTTDEAREMGERIGIDWSSAEFDVEQFCAGMEVELERNPATNVTHDDPETTAKIALAHLNEFPDYYVRLERMERDAERDHRTQ